MVTLLSVAFFDEEGGGLRRVVFKEICNVFSFISCYIWSYLKTLCGTLHRATIFILEVSVKIDLPHRKAYCLYSRRLEIF